MFRPEIGITAFLNNPDAKPWLCLFKHLQSDFVVQEILKGGKVCEITNEPQVYASPEEEDVLKNVIVDPPPKFTDDMQKQLAEFRSNTEAKMTVNAEDWTKEERRDLHVYIRTLGELDSTTSGNQIVITRFGNKRKRRQQQALEKKYVHFTLTKMDHDTAFSINLLTKLLNKNQNSFGYCGTKDRRAITSQRVSVFRMEPPKLYDLNKRLRGMKISDACFADENLALGGAWGNRFNIALREFTSQDDEEQLKKRIDDWKTDGFLNYFGDQRFGSWNNTTADVGRKILQRDWKGAVELILSPISGSETKLNEALIKYEETKDAKQAFDMVPNSLRFASNEGKLLKFLNDRPTDFKNALMTVPRNSRCLYVHAYQSLIFNKFVSRRAEKYGKKVIDGDLFMVDGEFVESGTITDVVLPLICFPSKYPDNEIRDWYMDVLAEDGITKEVFMELKGEFGIGQSMRTYIEKPQNVDYKMFWYTESDTILQNFPPFSETKSDELSEQPVEGARKAMLLQFDLSSGNYATVALRELLHADIGKETQRNLSIQLRNAKGDTKPDDVVQPDEEQ